MASISRRRQDWDEAGFRGLIRRYFEHNESRAFEILRYKEDTTFGFSVEQIRPGISKYKVPSSILGCIYDLGFAIHHDDTLKAQQLFEIFPQKTELEICILFYGAEASCSLVRYVVEERNLPIIDLLSSDIFKNDHGKSALNIAIENSQNDVLDYLLKDWVQIPVSILQLSEDFTLRMQSLAVGRRDQIIVCAVGHF